MKSELLKSLAINRPISYTPQNGEYRKHQLHVKESLIKEAISWPDDKEKDKYIYTNVWENDGYSIQFGKYGKEYYRVNRQNVNDMVPRIFQEGEEQELDASFRAVFKLIEKQFDCNNNDVIVTLACLFIRNAFLIDHKEAGDKFRYAPPIEATSFLQETIGKHYEIPIEVFLHYIDAIAWQEDVKYYTLGRGVNTDIGRTNNLLTYAHFCACLLKRAHWADMLNRYSMGVSPLPKANITEAFPELNAGY